MSSEGDGTDEIIEFNDEKESINENNQKNEKERNNEKEEKNEEVSNNEKEQSEKDDNTNDLSFWMHNSDTPVEESSDDDDTASLPTNLTPKKSRNSSSGRNTPRTRAKTKTPKYFEQEEEDEDDIVPIPQQVMTLSPQQNNFNSLPPMMNDPILNHIYQTRRSGVIDPEFVPAEYNYAPLKSKQSLSLANAVQSLQRELNAIQKDNDSDDDISVYEMPNHSKNDGDITLIFKYDPDNFETEINLSKGKALTEVFDNLPPQYQNFDVEIDGLHYQPQEVYTVILNDYCTINLVPRRAQEADQNLKKLAFLFPNGSKKKIAIDKTKTFFQVLQTLQVPKAKLMFDGETIQLSQRICDNDELEDGDQIDVCL